MKKYIHVYEDKIVERYISEICKVYGGPWQHGESLEVPEEMDLNKVVYEDGEIKEVE